MSEILQDFLWLKNVAFPCVVTNNPYQISRKWFDWFVICLWIMINERRVLKSSEEWRIRIGSTTTIDDRLRFPKFCFISTFFKHNIIRKWLRNSAIIPHFQKCFTDYGMGLQTVLKKCALRPWVSANLVFVFEVENGLDGRCENIVYRWSYDFLKIFAMCLRNFWAVKWELLILTYRLRSKSNHG